MRTTLRKDEEVILQVEKHWVVLIKAWCIFAGSVILLGAAFISYGEIASNYLSYIIGALVAAGLYLLYSIAERRVDIWVVTNLRVIDESGVITHRIKESPLDKINNVQYRHTVIGRILNFGDVEIQTAAEGGATINQFVSYPKLLHDTVVVMQGRLKDLDRQPARLHDDEMECPYCAEIVKKKAKVCKHCGKELVQSESSILSEDPSVSKKDRSVASRVDEAGKNPREWLIDDSIV